MRKIFKFIPTLSYTKAFLNLGEVFSKNLSEVQTQNERLRVGWKRWEHASYFWKSCKTSKYREMEVNHDLHRVVLRINIQKEKVLATRNPRYEESLEINLMHSLSSWNQASLFFDLIARGEQSLAVGVCWRSISVIFATNAPPDFMKQRSYSCQIHLY